MPKKKEEQKKIKILAWGDTPDCATGFGAVNRGIFVNLAKTGRYDIDFIGINETGDYKDPEKFGGLRIYPALPGLTAPGGDYMGRQRLVGALYGHDLAIRPPWDLVFTLNDPFVLDQVISKDGGTMKMMIKAQISYLAQTTSDLWFKIISYFPVDSPIRPNWVSDTIALPDHVVAYTNYGKDEILKGNFKLRDKEIKSLPAKMSVIYHGYDNEHFFPLEPDQRKAFRDKYYQGLVKDETFLVVLVGRNQMRKDIPRAMKIFADFKKRRPNSFLYIHAKENDVWGSIKEYGGEYGLVFGEDYAVPGNFNEHTGMTLETLNKIYNSADVLMSTNLGEGFGMTYIEAMGAGTLNLAPYHTTTPELFGLSSTDIDENARGLAFKCGTTKSEWVNLGPQDLHRERPLSNVDDAVKKLTWICDNPDKAKKIAMRAHEWIKPFTWENIAKEWDALFQKVYAELEDDRKNAEAIQADVREKLGMNNAN